MGERRIARGKLLGELAILLLSMALFGGPVSAAGSSGPPDSPDALHEVVPGDDLHLIAGYYYGDARQWERIWQANRQQVPNPNLIERGLFLRIPGSPAPDEPYADFVARVRPSPALAVTPEMTAKPRSRRP